MCGAYSQSWKMDEPGRLRLIYPGIYDAFEKRMAYAHSMLALVGVVISAAFIVTTSIRLYKGSDQSPMKIIK